MSKYALFLKHFKDEIYIGERIRNSRTFSLIEFKEVEQVGDLHPILAEAMDVKGYPEILKMLEKIKANPDSQKELSFWEGNSKIDLYSGYNQGTLDDMINLVRKKSEKIPNIVLYLSIEGDSLSTSLISNCLCREPRSEDNLHPLLMEAMTTKGHAAILRILNKIKNDSEAQKNLETYQSHIPFNQYIGKAHPTTIDEMIALVEKKLNELNSAVDSSSLSDSDGESELYASYKEFEKRVSDYFEKKSDFQKEAILHRFQQKRKRDELEKDASEQVNNERVELKQDENQTPPPRSSFQC